MSLFSKNCIISGEVDYYCLLCKEAFTNEDQSLKHTEWIDHKKKVKPLTYLRKFQQHKIYKIDHIYYCKVCGEVMYTIKSLRAHVQEDKHTANIVAFSKDTKQLAPVPPESSENTRKLIQRHEDTEFVLLCNLALNNLQWHSITRNKCWLCDMAIRNRNELTDHLVTLNHMVRLIQSRCYVFNFVATQYFRKINEEEFYCFVCEKTSPMSSLPTHWEEKEHTESLSVSVTTSSSKSTPSLDPKVFQVELKLLETQLPYYTIDQNSGRAICIQCLDRFPLKYLKLVKHRKKHIAVSWPTDEPEALSQPKPIDYGQHRANMAKFAKENFMRTTHGGHRAFCWLCKVHLPATKKKVTEHIKGLRHQGFLQIKGHIKRYYKEQIEPTKYATLSEYVEHVFPLPPESSLIVINRKYLLSVLSFNFIIRIEIDKLIEKTFCYICDAYLDEVEVNDHINDETHKQKCEDVRVIADHENDFIRKIRDFEYHCGYCNELWSSYKSITGHLLTKKHNSAKQNRALPKSSTKILNNEATEAELENFLKYFKQKNN